MSSEAEAVLAEQRQLLNHYEKEALRFREQWEDCVNGGHAPDSKQYRSPQYCEALKVRYNEALLKHREQVALVKELQSLDRDWVATHEPSYEEMKEYELQRQDKEAKDTYSRMQRRMRGSAPRRNPRTGRFVKG